MLNNSNISNNRTGNVSNTIYSILYKNIVNLNLVPGTLMSEKEIAEKMNVSRTPVREAFIKLSKEALVSIYPQKGTFVSKIDLSRVQEERFLRESLEFQVLEDFIANHSEENIDSLLKCLEYQKQSLESDDVVKFIEYDDQFHSIFFLATNKARCYGVIKSFSGHYRRIRYLSLSISGVSDENLIQHLDLVGAIRRGALDEARNILKKHLRKLIIEEDNICLKYPEYFEKDNSQLGDDKLFRAFRNEDLISNKKDMQS